MKSLSRRLREIFNAYARVNNLKSQHIDSYLKYVLNDIITQHSSISFWNCTFPHPHPATPLFCLVNIVFTLFLVC